ncbi:MAG TPA: hypothetical protein EYP58_03670 [bacterium (Candidatus Stahlbacteria)]|nr:hypothetical protein [Candidatus Stahlbacteria bacterium]
MKQGILRRRSGSKKVLIIAYYFPPLGGPGVLRPLKLAKYLKYFSWQPIVLTVRPTTYHIYDYSNLAEMKFPVYRSESLDPARILYLLGKRKGSFGVVNLWRRLINLPDTRAGWLPFATDSGFKLGQGCQAVISTAPPFTAHIIGCLIARRFSLPLITDFRDCLVDFPYLPYYPWQKPIVKYLQDLVLEMANAVTVAFDDILLSFPERFRSKVEVIYNGFDPGDFFEVEPSRIFTISHMGSITPRRPIDPIIKAVARITKEISKFRLQLIGYIHPDEQKKIKDVRDNVEIYGYLDHKEAIAKLQQSHLLLLLNSKLDSPAPGRQAEYAATRLPIIVIGHEGSCPILRRLEKSRYPIRFVDYDDLGRLADCIIRSSDAWQNGRVSKFEGNLDFLDRRKQARIFSQILNRLCGNSLPKKLI